MSIIIWIVIGLLAGWLANVILGSGGGGLFAKLAVGLIGAIVGGAVLGALQIVPAENFLGQLVSATIGAVIFLLIWRAIRRA